MAGNLLILFFLVTMVITLVMKLRAIGRRLTGVESKCQQSFHEHDADIGALCTGASGMGEHLSRLEQHIRRLHERQEQLEMRDPIDREYHQAVKMIRNGAGIEDLVSSGGLARAEAELLLMLHGDKGKDKDKAAWRAGIERDELEAPAADSKP